MSKSTSKKIGRNAPCPCGSGQKYKRCHGNALQRVTPPHNVDKVNELMERHKAKELQRERQQGLGRPIISADLNGQRIMAVGNEVFWSEQWKTFHDFLGHYITFVFGREWGNAELRKPVEDRHPVCAWYHYVCQHQQRFVEQPGRVSLAPMIGATAAWYHLAYDLYSLAHNAELQAKLVARLKNPTGFRGARYEVYVAGALIRAGFDVEFENEDDRSSTHCEFTVTCRSSGNKYSVEAKQRDPNDQRGESNGNFRLGRRLQKALRKAAAYPRIVFIDINEPDTTDGSDQMPRFLRKALDDIRKFEGRTLAGQPLPPAYIFVTNHPFEHDLEGTQFRVSVLSEGFQIPDFKTDNRFPSIRDVYNAREKHRDMHQLLSSLNDHSAIPSTFDGEPPEFVFQDNPPRLIIGESYIIPDGQGRKLRGKLTTATVDINIGVVHGAYHLDDGRSVLVTSHLTEAELAAYKRHPDVFFGVPLSQNKKIDTPLELFDFFHDSYRNTPKEILLEFLSDASDIEQLRTMSQQNLAFIYAERCAYSILRRQDTFKGKEF